MGYIPLFIFIPPGEELLSGIPVELETGAGFLAVGLAGGQGQGGYICPPLLETCATNMSYMLSVQMAATLLNIRCKGANYDDLGIVVDGEWVLIGDLIQRANDFLSQYPKTPPGDPNRAQAEFYKNLFDDLNWDRRKLIPYEPCPVSGCSVE